MAEANLGQIAEGLTENGYHVVQHEGYLQAYKRQGFKTQVGPENAVTLFAHPKFKGDAMAVEAEAVQDTVLMAAWLSEKHGEKFVGGVLFNGEDDEGQYTGYAIGLREALKNAEEVGDDYHIPLSAMKHLT